MDQHNLELRLLGLKSGVTDGEIRLIDLAGIAEALHELNIRIARLVIGQEGVGRSRDAAAQVAQLRLAGISVGSTRLLLSSGGPPPLAPEFSNTENETAEKFWEIVTALAVGRRPAWTTALVAQSTLDLLAALSRTATGAIVSRADDRTVNLSTLDVPTGTWEELAHPRADEDISVAGQLFALDLETRNFRIRDDIGNVVFLEDVRNAAEAAVLVGGRAVATGRLIAHDGESRTLTSAVVSKTDTPTGWAAEGGQFDLTTFSREAALLSGPDPAGIPGVGGDEMDTFLASIRR